MEYRKMINGFALNSVNKSVDIPDSRLCIGSAERLDSVPVLLFSDFATKPPRVKFEDIQKKPIESFGRVGDGNYISADDFENDNFFENINLKGE